MYRLLRRTENDLRQIADSQLIIENKHVFAYVSGMGFGVISGAFAFVNVLADSVNTTLYTIIHVMLTKYK